MRNWGPSLGMVSRIRHVDYRCVFHACSVASSFELPACFFFLVRWLSVPIMEMKLTKGFAGLPKRCLEEVGFFHLLIGSCSYDVTIRSPQCSVLLAPLQEELEKANHNTQYCQCINQ